MLNKWNKDRHLKKINELKAGSFMLSIIIVKHIND